jgi:hypothetical protein
MTSNSDQPAGSDPAQRLGGTAQTCAEQHTGEDD